MSNRYTNKRLLLSAFISFQFFAAPLSAGGPSEFERALKHPGFNLKRTSIMVADAANGKIIAKHLPDMPLNPASCAKVVTTTAALFILGPDHRFTTDIFSDAEPRGGVIKTLYVRGAGDPMFVNEEIAMLSVDLYSKGIRRITDGIVVDNSYFDSYEYPRKMTGEGRAYTAKTSATAVNFNTVTIKVGPGKKAGAPGTIATDPPADYFKIVNKTVTGKKFRAGISMRSVGGQEVITVSGQVPLKFGEQEFYRSVENPVLHSAAIIKYWLEQNGIDVHGVLRAGKVPASAVKIASHSSRPLAELVGEMNKASNNFMAEQLMKHIGAAKFGAPGSTAKGVMAVEDFMAGIGIPKGTYTLENGSGLSDVTRVSAEQLVNILVAGYRSPKIRKALVESLSILGVDGTTKKWRFASDLTGRVYVKTGTINAVSALAGFAPTANGGMAAFAILANNLPRGAWTAHEAELGVVRAIANK